MRATSLEARANRTASLCESLSVVSKNCTCSSSCANGVGVPNPNIIRVRVVYSLSSIFSSLFNVWFILPHHISLSTSAFHPATAYIPLIRNIIGQFDPAIDTTISSSHPISSHPRIPHEQQEFKRSTYSHPQPPPQPFLLHPLPQRYL